MRIQTYPLRAVSPNPLLYALTQHFASVSRFYRYDPRDPSSWERMAEEVKTRLSPPPRETLASILMRQNRLFGADETTLSGIEALKDERTLVVSTGQQTGLFTGPLYTIYKAVTAVKLAKTVEQRLGRRVVPVFWMAADDHDFAEIDHTIFCLLDTPPRRLALPGHDPNDRRSASSRRFGEAVQTLTNECRESLAGTPFQQEVVTWLQTCCTTETSMSEGFARLMTLLFKGHGLLLVDPTDPELKTLAASIFEREAAFPLVSTGAVLTASDTLHTAGFPTQIERTPDAVNLFVYRDKQRVALSYRDARFYTRDGQSYAPETLLDMIREHPETFSHNAITRPIVQDTLFPVLAYVGGPAEIGYYGQLDGVYKHFGLPFPIVYPRASLTLIEPRVARIMETLELTPEDFLTGVWPVFEQRLRTEMSEELAASFEHARTEFSRHFETIGRLVEDIDVTLGRVAEAAERKSLFELERLEEKAVQAIKRKHKTTRDQLQAAVDQIVPLGHPQERVASIWPFVARHGVDLMDTLFEAIDVSDFSHRVVYL
ncbi:MAG: bacillithiol biosynthesis cysteine-adding enzyme BshC [candidate division Zixibacteria bacterium]|nr:bacillithiol biosynthesis cysteine-adding enzyme BshC [candidate division Zixibacteria bacterium]